MGRKLRLYGWVRNSGDSPRFTNLWEKAVAIPFLRFTTADDSSPAWKTLTISMSHACR